MKIYFSGWAVDIRPAAMERRASFMLTFYEINKKSPCVGKLLKAYLERKEKEPGARSEDCFIDSGAWSLFRKELKRTGHAPKASYYSLKPGSDFRKYCDRYASFIKWRNLQGKVTYFANVDAIGNAEVTRLNQEYFEKEHGLRPVPVVHLGCSMSYLEDYLKEGHEMIGLGGMAHRPDRKEILNWCDEAFLLMCPQSNKRMPVCKPHGFGLTTWELMKRWPWFSVDSSSYLCYRKYGMMVVPSKSRIGKYDFLKPPMIVSVSTHRSPYPPEDLLGFMEPPTRVGGRKVDFKSHMHISQNLYRTEPVRMATNDWLRHLGLKLGSVGENGEIQSVGVASHNDTRTSANLRYFMEFEAALPAWPWRLSDEVIKRSKRLESQSFGL